MENNKNENKAFFSYCHYPNIKFETYEPGEEVILLIHAHPFTQLSWIVNAFFLLIFLVVSNFFITSFFNPSQIFFFDLFFIIFILSYLWFNFINWYFNVGIVTNRRVIDIDFDSVLYKQITVAQLDRIQDMTVKSGGYFGTFFNFGSIFIQTAGTEENIVFVNAPHPAEVVDIINQLLGKQNGS